MARLQHLLVVAVALSGGTAVSQSLTTLFGANGGGSNGGAMFFDVNVTNPGGIVVTGLELNTLSTVAGGLTIWVTPGSYVGRTGDRSLWSEVSSGADFGQGFDTPTFVDVSDFDLAPGSYGVAILMSSTWRHAYTNGNGANQIHSNADLILTAGASSNSPFRGGVFTPRVWNGTIYYSGAGNGQASYGVFGAGCGPTSPRLTASWPRIGRTFSMSVRSIPVASLSPSHSALRSRPGPAVRCRLT